MGDTGSVLFELSEALAETDAAGGHTDALANAVDLAWDVINPHNAMELALVIGQRLPVESRTKFGEQTRSRLEKRTDFEDELEHNSANHCLQRVLNNNYEGL